MGIAALIASAWGMLVAPSRTLLVLDIASFCVASVTLALWWNAVWTIVRSS